MTGTYMLRDSRYSSAYARVFGFVAPLFLVAALYASEVHGENFGSVLADHLNGDTEAALSQARDLAELEDIDAILFLAQEAQRRFFQVPGSEPATELYAKAASLGSAQAQLRLGQIYHQRALEADNAVDQQSQFRVARHWYRLAAEQKHIAAAFALAGLLRNGHGGPQSLAEAAEYYRIAAEAGFPGAGLEFGLMLVRQNDFEQAKSWILEAAETGDANAQSVLAEMYLFGLGVEQNDLLSLNWLSLAAESGHQGAQRDLAARYWSGLGVIQDQEKAISLLQAAADGGNVSAQLDLGWMTYRGLGLPINYELARQYFEAAAEAGAPEGNFRLAQMIQNGNLGYYDAETNQRLVADKYRLAAEQGYLPAQLALAVLYESGHVNVRNLEQALIWYKAAADNGDPRGRDAYETMFEQGRGVPRFDDGPVSHFSNLPDVLFLTGSLGSGDFARINAAIDRYEPSLIVLDSPGGVVADAIQTAEIIFSRGINTYVPRTGQCLSACVYIFVAGQNRLVLGDLGVHQLQAAQAEASVPIGDLQAIISQIITALNRYSVPPFMIERILSSREMYFLSRDEREVLSRNGPDLMGSFNAELTQSVFDYQFN